MKNFKIEQFNPNDSELKVVEIVKDKFSYINKGDHILTVEGQKASYEITSELSGYINFNFTLDQYFDIDDYVYSIADDISAFDNINQKLLKEKASDKTVNNDVKKKLNNTYLELRTLNNFNINVAVIFAGKALRQLEDVVEKIHLVKITHLFDDQKINDYRYKGKVDIDLIQRLYNERQYDFVFICTGNNNLRANIFNQLKCKGVKFFTFIHPSVQIGKNVSIGENVYVGPNTNISNFSNVSSCCFISANCNIEHHSTVGNNTLFGPGVLLSGSVTIGENCLISSGVSFESNLNCGDNVFISTGLGINKNVKSNERILK